MAEDGRWQKVADARRWKMAEDGRRWKMAEGGRPEDGRPNLSIYKRKLGYIYFVRKEVSKHKTTTTSPTPPPHPPSPTHPPSPPPPPTTSSPRWVALTCGCWRSQVMGQAGLQVALHSSHRVCPRLIST